MLFLDVHGYGESPLEPSQALDALLRSLGVPDEHIPASTDERAGLYLSLLADRSDPVLVIVDDACSEAQVQPLLPGTGRHQVLVTSRHVPGGLNARLVSVMILDESTSVALLDAALRAARPEDDRIAGDRAAAGQLARICGGLPLALQIVASLLKIDVALTAAGLAEELATESMRLEQLRYDDGSGAAAPSVAAAFELSYRRLEKRPARLFRLLPVNPGPDVSAAAAAILADLPLVQARGILRALARAHLIEPAPSAGGRWHMHDLLRLYAQQMSDAHAVTDDREQARDRLLGYYLRMSQAADDHLRAGPGMTVPGEFSNRGAALDWMDVERPNLVAAVTMAAETGRDQMAMWLPFNLALYFNQRRWFDDLLAAAAASLDAARRLGDGRNEAVALTHLGVAFSELGRPEEAITAIRGAAALYRAIGDRNLEGGAVANLGNFLSDSGRFAEAIGSHRSAVAIFRETGDRSREGRALDNLGLALRSAGRLKEAIAAHQDAVAIFREISERADEGTALAHLSQALHDAGQLEDAINALQDATIIDRETGDRPKQKGDRPKQKGDRPQQTGDRPQPGEALNNLGLWLLQAGKPGEAMTAHQDAAQSFCESGDRSEEGMALNNLGVALEELRRFEEAIAAFQHAAELFRATGQHDAEIAAVANLDAIRAAQQA